MVNQKATGGGPAAGVPAILGEVPLGLLELAVRWVIRENVYHVVPLPGVVWTASSATRVAETAGWRLDAASASGGGSWGIRGM